jgi:hypothetical protein
MKEHYIPPREWFSIYALLADANGQFANYDDVTSQTLELPGNLHPAEQKKSVL